MADDGLVYCGDAFCDLCGDCIACYGDDPCYDGGTHAYSARIVSPACAKNDHGACLYPLQFCEDSCHKMRPHAE